MNRFSHSALASLTAFTAAALLLFTAAPVDSQMAAETLNAPQSPEAALLAAKAANKALLEKQRATLDRLDAIQKDASQLRIFVRRS